MTTTTLLLEISSGLVLAATSIAIALVGSALALGAMISKDAEQREAPVRSRPPLPTRYFTRGTKSVQMKVLPRSPLSSKLGTKQPTVVVTREVPPIGALDPRSR